MSRLRPALPYLALAGFALFAALPLAHRQMTCSDDGFFHIAKAVTLEQLIRDGHFFGRWSPHMAHGYGYPYFNYYGPLASYVLVALHSLGFTYPAGLHLFLGACVWLAGVGVYWLVREWFPLRPLSGASGVYEREAAGLAAGVVYMTAPYLAFDVLYRAALAETFALVWPPIILVTLHRALSQKSIPLISRWSLLAALAFAALMYSHNTTALAVAPFAAGYVIFLALMRRDARVLVSGGLSLILGLGLSARFWLPALIERHLVQSDRLLVPPIFTYYTNYLSPRELLAPPIPADPLLINPSPAKGLGLVAVGLALVGFAAIAYRIPHIAYRISHIAYRKLSINNWHPAVNPLLSASFFLFILVIYSLLTLPLSQPIWDHIPLMPFIQFPWRLLGPGALCAAVLAGSGVHWLPRQRWWLASAIALVAALGHLSWWYPRYCGAMEEVDLARTIQFEYDTFTIGTTAKGEFLPTTVYLFPPDDSLGQAIIRGEQPQHLAGLPPGAQLTLAHADPLNYRATLNSPTSFRLTFNQFYFPGWRAALDDQPVPIQLTPDTGLITVLIPPGQHRLRFYFGDTPIRTLGNALSIISLLWVLGFGLWGAARFRRASREPNPQPLRAGTGLIAFTLLAFSLPLVRFFVIDRTLHPLRRSAFDRESQTVSAAQTPLRAEFAGGVQLYGYDLSTTILPADGSVDISLYVSVREHVERRYWPAFTLTDAAGLSWNDLEALPPRWHKEPPHTPYWPPGEYAQWARHLTLLPGTPPGQYRLVGEVFDIDSLQIASLLDEQGNAVSPRFGLGTLTVTRPRRPFVLQPAHAAPHTFGPVTLLGYNLDRTETSAGDTVLLTLYWRSEAATSNNYTAHVEGSKAPGGKAAFSVDLTPANGYPTSAWQPGDQWRGQHPIQLPAALESGEYQLVLSLPGEEGAQPLGRIKVTAPTRTFMRPAVEVENGSVFEGVGVLEGYTLEREGSTLTFNLTWRATASPRVSYAAFVHLSDEAGRAWAQSDAVPAKWTRPTTGWVAGEYVVDPHMLSLPPDLPPGQYQLFIGLYDLQTGQRVRVSGPGAGEDNRVEIGRITLP